MDRLDEWTPRHRDAAIAHVRPESSLLEYFKQSLSYTCTYCTDTRCCNFHEKPIFSTRTEDEFHEKWQGYENEQGQPNADLAYPLVLFEKLKELPPVHVLHDLAKEFRSRCLMSIPFLSTMECVRLPLTELPFYLLLPQALLGPAASKGHQSRDKLDILWRAGDNLLLGISEVDNSIGRSIVWHSAVSPPLTS